MDIKLAQNLKELASICRKPIYVVGGYVRNYLADGTVSEDVDLASPVTSEELLPCLKKTGFEIIAQYKRTNTVIFTKDNGIKYEFTTFRTDSYANGGHTPSDVMYTDDINVDARRRDFACNAVYYDIKAQRLIDPIGHGISDVENRVLDTVVAPEKVFKDDGLRILRLCRLHGETGFVPTADLIKNAKRFGNNLKEISAERIYAEIKRMLVADKKYAFSPVNGHYMALKLMEQCGAMQTVLPELYAGKNMAQRADYHLYDVLEHSLRCVLYANPSVRLAALLHDVGKPYCMNNFGKYHLHEIYGEKIVADILIRLKASVRETEEIKRLVRYHMLDIKSNMRENKLRLFIAKNLDIFEKMLFLKQADYSACKDDLSEAPTVIKWKNCYTSMQKQHVPFDVKMLEIDGSDIVSFGVKGKAVGEILDGLWKHCVYCPKDNNRQRLLFLAENAVKKYI